MTPNTAPERLAYQWVMTMLTTNGTLSVSLTHFGSSLRLI